MTTWKRKKLLGQQLDIPWLATGNTVVLRKKGAPTIRGEIIGYEGIGITPENKGRCYRVRWADHSVTVHFHSELLEIKPRMMLRNRPKEVL